MTPTPYGRRGSEDHSADRRPVTPAGPTLRAVPDETAQDRRRAPDLLRAAGARVARAARVVAGQVADAAVIAVAGPPPPTRRREGRVGRLVHGAVEATPVAVALLLLLISTVELNSRNDPPGPDVGGPVIFLAAVLAAAPVALVRRAPLWAFRAGLAGGVLAAGLVAPLLDDLPMLAASAIGVPLTVYAAVSRTRQDIAYGTVACAAVALAILGSTASVDHPDVVWVWSVLTVAAAATYGATVRGRRQAQGALLAEEARSAEQRAARAVLEERTRIARELHDVVAHHMSAIAIQAEAAPLTHGHDPDALRGDLAQIRATALDSLAEMRRILGVLRDPSTGAALSPTPGLDDLDGLLTTARAAGLAVTVEVLGTPTRLATGVDVSAYRILQEALSNVMRHAPGSAVAITIAHRIDPPVLSLEVHNGPGEGGPPVEVGSTPHGVVGMRERAAALGGDLHAGPAADGGFLVQARLPLVPA